MKILGLDVSTKTGFAVLQDGVLVSSGLLKAEAVYQDKLAEDFSILQRAEDMSSKLLDLVKQNKPNFIFIEQTNSGRFRTSQKQLEFIHCLLLSKLNTLGCADVVRYVDTSKWRSSLQIRLTKSQREHNKNVKNKKARGKITPKHLAVAWANDTFGLSLKKKDNDIADAICLAVFGGNSVSCETVSVNYDIDNILLNK